MFKDGGKVILKAIVGGKEVEIFAIYYNKSFPSESTHFHGNYCVEDGCVLDGKDYKIISVMGYHHETIKDKRPYPPILNSAGYCIICGKRLEHYDSKYIHIHRKFLICRNLDSPCDKLDLFSHQDYVYYTDG